MFGFIDMQWTEPYICPTRQMRRVVNLCCVAITPSDLREFEDANITTQGAHDPEELDRTMGL
jgi:hypothetical protein